jgi:hypothetical protein
LIKASLSCRDFPSAIFLHFCAKHDSKLQFKRKFGFHFEQLRAKNYNSVLKPNIFRKTGTRRAFLPTNNKIWFAQRRNQPGVSFQ